MMTAVKRTILVTGSTDGIGKQTALNLADNAENAVIVHGRDRDRCQKTVAIIKEQTGNGNVDFVVADFNRMANVSHLAEEVKNRFPALNVLLCNAGVLLPKRQLSLDHLELTFQVNYLAHFALVNLLLDKLTENRPARIVFVSSICHDWHPLNWDDLQAEMEYEKYVQYSRTKLELHMFGLALAKRLHGSGVTCNVCEPGVIETKLLRAGGYHGAPVATGAKVTTHLCQSDDVKDVSGKYFSHELKLALSYPDSENEEFQSKLWVISTNLWKASLND